MDKSNKNIKGQVMVEAIVALSVIVIGIMAVFSLTTRSIGLNRVAADRFTAVNLTGEGIELVRNLLDKNIMDDGLAWNNLPGFTQDGDYEIDYNDIALTKLTGTGRPLLFNKTNGFYLYSDESGEYLQSTTFKRRINIKNINSYHIKVVSLVEWTSRGSDFEFSVEDDFYDLEAFKKQINEQLQEII